MKKVFLSLMTVLILGAGAFFARDLIFPSADRLVITMNVGTMDLSPYDLDLNNITRTGNIYEGLVGFDRNLRIVPALAVSWGNVDNLTWEFRLRQGASFHDGSAFNGQDVIEAFEKAKSSNNPQIEPHINTVQSMSLVNDDRLIIKTTAPDPLLLSKLTKLFIYKEDNIGTGPYRVKNWTPGHELELVAFEDYWGSSPSFRHVVYDVEPSQIERENSFAGGKIDILAAVTQQQALSLPKERIKTSYGLEVNFLMFKLDDPVFAKREMREAVQQLIDPKSIEEIGNGFVRSADQFVAPGVFGYNQNIQPFPYDPTKEPRNLFGIKLERVNLDYLATFKTLSQYLTVQMRKAGFLVNSIPNEPNALLEKVQNNESQMYLLGWRADDGDAGGFFESFIHSEGPFNKGRYSNPRVDGLIEEARREMDPQKRLVLLQEIGNSIQEDLLGIPLFEPSRLYALKEGIKWEPRLDGVILASEVTN